MEETMSEHDVDGRSGITRRICTEGGENPGIEITNTDDDGHRLWGATPPLGPRSLESIQADGVVDLKRLETG